MLRAVLSALLLFPLPLSLQAQAIAAQSDPATPGHGYTVQTQRAAGAIRVDGELDDAGWAGAARITGFTEFAPTEGAAPAVATEVLLTYDDKYLYVAFIAQSEPAEVRASWRNRDQIWDDDNVGILIDPYGNSALGYLLVVNPYGIQGDLLMTSQGEDPSWDAIFESRGRITEQGYQVELAIPFRSLRFPNREVQSWRVNFWRNLPRTDRHMLTWAPISQNNPCMLCQSGAMTGLEGVRPGGGLELLPAVVASKAGRLQDSNDAGSFAHQDATGQLSLGAKYAFAGGWTVEGTLNPDFSQVEADAAQIDVNSTFALSYPERRPFFQEGSDLYNTRIDVFYSRSINAPQFAAKVTGRTGRTNVGYIVARDELTPFILPFAERSAGVAAGRSISNIARVRHNLSNGAHVGLLLTDRRLEQGGAGSNVSVDALFRFREVYGLRAQLVGSYTQEPTDSALSENVPDLEFGRGDKRYTAAFDGESFAGHAVHLGVNRSARFWSFRVDYSDASPTYRSDAGFQTRNDFRRATGSTDLTFRPNRYGFKQVSPRLHAGSIWSFDGENKDLWFGTGLFVLLPYQTHVGVHGFTSREVFRGVEFDGIQRFEAFFGTTPTAALQMGASVEAGTSIARNLETPELGNGLNLSVWSNLRPFDRLVVSPSVNYSRLARREGGEMIYQGYVARVRTEYQFNRELSFRLVTQYNDFSKGLDVDPLIVYRLNPFSIFYLGSTQASRKFEDEGWVGTSRQYFLKFQYLFQL